MPILRHLLIAAALLPPLVAEETPTPSEAASAVPAETLHGMWKVVWAEGEVMKEDFFIEITSEGVFRSWPPAAAPGLTRDKHGWHHCPYLLKGGSIILNPGKDNSTVIPYMVQGGLLFLEPVDGRPSVELKRAKLD